MKISRPERSSSRPSAVRPSLALAALSPLMGLVVPPVDPPRPPHQDTHTHASLTAGALTLLSDDFYSAARRGLIIQASVDEDQCPNYLSHFYNPKTGADGRIFVAPCSAFPTVTTALVRAVTFYGDAVAHYRQGDRDG